MYHIYSFEDVKKLGYDAILIDSFSKEKIQKIENLEINLKKIYSL